VKHSSVIAVITSLVMFAAPVLEAEAKRLGGGLNIGRTAPSKPAPAAVPPKQAQPAQTTQPGQAAPAAATAQTAAQQGSRSFLGPIAGIAAFVGLAALAAHLGIGAEIMSMLLIALAALAVFALFRYFSSARRSAAGQYGQPAMARSGYGNADLGAEARPGGQAWLPAGGSAQNATPSASAGSNPLAQPAAMAPQASQSEINQFLKVAQDQFHQLQAIWDSADIHALSEFCTPEMTRVLSHQIAERQGQANHTQVVSLKAQWVGMNPGTDDFGNAVDEVQVRFSGLIRETEDGFALNFDELWTLQRPVAGAGGWLLAGIAQLS
jgi:predicted lipid-binding transport protein (Tim44 family)